MTAETIPVNKQALQALVDEVVRTIRRHGGPNADGNGTLASALAAVNRDKAEAELQLKLEKPLRDPVPREEEA